MPAKSLTALILILSSAAVAADPRWYAGADIAFSGIEIENETFYPISTRARFGGWLRENIGIELIAGGGVKDDDQAGLTLDVSQAFTIAGRFQSPLDLGMKAYILLGYAETQLDGKLTTSDFPGKETFRGGMVALGGLWPLTKSGGLSLSLEFSGYFTDDEDDIGIGGLSLGMLYDF